MNQGVPAHERLRLLLTEWETIDAEVTRRRRDCGMDFYVPNPLQDRAHRSDRKTLIYVGGNRSGKSTFGAMELAWALTRRYPDWYPAARKFPPGRPLRAVVSATSFPIIERAIEPKIRMYLPKAFIAHTKRTPQQYLQRLTMQDGSTIDFISREMDDMACESADWDFYWGDEPQDKTKFYAIRRGLVDRGGLTVLTFTPLIEPWMKAELVDRATEFGYAVFTATMWDNAKNIHGQPILDEANIRRYEAEMPDDMKQSRIYGQFFHLRGLVYQEYNPAVHEWIERPDQGVRGYEYPDPVIAVCDPHDRTPHHVLWAFISRKDHLYVDRELILHCDLQELSKAILVTEAQAGYRLVKRLIDPNFGRSPAAAGSNATVIAELAKLPYKVRFLEANDDKTAGHLRVKELLHYDRTKPLSFLNTPRLFFHATRCPKTIASMRNYQYEDWQGKTKEDRDPKETPKPKENHGADCVRYLAMSLPSYDRLSPRVPDVHEVLY